MPKKVEQIVADNIKRLRGKRHWSKLQLAQESKTHISTVARLETGESGFSSTTLESIAAALGVSVLELFRVADDNDNKIAPVVKQLEPKEGDMGDSEKARFMEHLQSLNQTVNFLRTEISALKENIPTHEFHDLLAAYRAAPLHVRLAAMIYLTGSQNYVERMNQFGQEYKELATDALESRQDLDKKVAEAKK